ISLEDMMTRFERMNQKETLYIPGTDHAGIATQNVVERELLKQGIKRKEIGREKFVEKVWEWKDIYHKRITTQSKRLGISSDWSRERFTLDEQLSHAVREAFYRLYQKGLIYRGEYMVNWCPGRCESAISDLEAISEESEGHLWYIKYPITGKYWKKPKNEWGSGKWAEGATNFITVATTRPETLLGDSAIATTSKHKKYGKFIGKKAVLPAVGRKIPIISDPHVDPEFGTGAVKITPSHDPNDFEVGQRHNLEFINILDEKARILPEISDRYANMDRYECRKAIIEDIKKEGLLVDIESHMHAIAHCQRCNTIIEPRVSIQWFAKTTELAPAAVESVKNKETIIIPKREEHRFYLWMDNIHDWCISRQLWWGHRIPVWYCNDCNAEICPEPNIDHVDTCPECESKNIEQEEDVLDTWFSSGLWPFSTLGWPNLKSPDYKRFYPNDMRETGYDILFFWVAKELMLGIELTGKSPYKTVYLHGMIRDAKGQKISKSMENIEDYDPLKIIEKLGADSLRYALISNSVPGLDTNVDPRNLDAAHRFCNKIWQATRFVLSNIKEDDEIKPFTNELKDQLAYSDKWILSRINRVSERITGYMTEFNYLKASREIKNFFWNEFCDWYIEISKIRLYDAENRQSLIQKTVLLHVLETSLRLLHPIMPFITEKLWQSLPKDFTKGPSIMFSQWPQTDLEFIDEEIEEKFTIIFDFIREIRSIKHDFGIPLNTKIP
ncbi:MAG: valine--tRNA ligase, partial [Promethearchaeota archaeon]